MTDTSSLDVTKDDFVYFVDRALDSMLRIVTELGDDLANERPAFTGANSPLAVLTHCLGIVEYWAGHLIAGRDVTRDRASEFEARGRVDDLAARCQRVRTQFIHDLAGAVGSQPLRFAPDPAFLGPHRTLTQAGALVHLYEELAQHHGQMEVVRDVIRSGRGESGPREVTYNFNPPLAKLRARQGIKWHRPDADVLAAWVADMDFDICPPVRDALTDLIDRDDLGYPHWPSQPLAEPFAERMASRYEWRPDPSYVRGTDDVIQAMQVVLNLCSEPGDAVVVHVPAYTPFLSALSTMRRQRIESPMIRNATGWTFDADSLDERVRTSGAKALILVNPHNPTGHMFSRDELERLAEIAERHDLIVISDEIHAELALIDRPHVPFASLHPSIESRTITITSASKAFNLAGLRAAVVHIGSERVRRVWDALPPDFLGAPNRMGIEATLAAWRSGTAWLDELVSHLRFQRDHLTTRVPELVGVTMSPPDATYLAWLDCSKAPTRGEPARFFLDVARVELSPGTIYGPGGEGHARLNFATSSILLDQMLDRMKSALDGQTGDSLPQ